MEKTKRYWFVRKTYGYGWVPGTWEGWLVLGVYTGGLISIIMNIDHAPLANGGELVDFLLPALLFTVALLLITVIKGEKPRWQWGEQKKPGSDKQ